MAVAPTMYVGNTYTVSYEFKDAGGSSVSKGSGVIVGDGIEDALYTLLFCFGVSFAAGLPTPSAEGFYTTGDPEEGISAAFTVIPISGQSLNVIGIARKESLEGAVIAMKTAASA